MSHFIAALPASRTSSFDIIDKAETVPFGVGNPKVFR